MPLIIGLTGGIGSGKSSTAKFFAALGAELIDTDVIAHELTQAQGAAIDAIRQIFTKKFITEEGSLDRKKMRSLIFSDNESRRKLEAILHPLIRIEVARRAALLTTPYAMIVVPLLLETGGYQEMIHRILVVDCNERDQIARAVARTGRDEQTVCAIMATQLSRNERLQQADDVIANDGDMEHLQKQVNILHRKYLALAGNS
jgi:dephospho-CoA kinase